MQCPRCKSERIQRDYDDAVIVLRVIGLHKLLCNNCGLVFKGFDPLRTVQRAPAEKEAKRVHNRRKVPRYNVHLPAAISLVDDRVRVGKVSYSEPSRGHCETVSKTGMNLSLVERGSTGIPRILRESARKDKRGDSMVVHYPLRISATLR